MKIGRINKLTISRRTDHGLYLVDDLEDEVLLPKAYVKSNLRVDDEIEVFIYKDSDDRIVATTLTPDIKIGEFAFLQVKDVNQIGAFIDWGLPKDLLVPYAEQNVKMKAGYWYLIYLLEDEQTERLVGSAKINRYIDFKDIELKPGDEVDLLLFNLTDIGMNAIVNGKHKGLIFNSDIHKDLSPGDKIKGYVKQVREDGKIDILLEPIGYTNSIDENSNSILSKIKENDGFLELTDKSSPEDIQNMLGLSKKAFKRGIGFLYKEKLIEIEDKGIRLI
jgi:predicted RNA-binding protein (virulence factor B family)